MSWRGSNPQLHACQLCYQFPGEGEHAEQQSPAPHTTPTLLQAAQSSPVFRMEPLSVGEGVTASGLWCKVEREEEVRWLPRAVGLKPQALEGTRVGTHRGRGVTAAKGVSQL